MTRRADGAAALVPDRLAQLLRTDGMRFDDRADVVD
jgi:hypothetical protein